MPLSQAELAILVTGKDVSATRVMRGVGREADSFGRKLGAIGGRAGRNFARNMERTIIAGSVAAAGAIGYALNLAGDFEAQLNTINTIARKDADGLNAIGDSIRAIARETGTPLEDLTAGYYDLLSAGISAADAQNVLRHANTLAIGGLASTAETVDLLTTAINTYGGDATKAAEYTDYFAKAVERGKVKASEIANSFATVGPIAAASGIELQELAAGYARLTAAGVPASEAATQMRAAIVSLTRTTGPLEKLQKQTGRNYLEIAGKKGLVAALQLLRQDADKAGVPLIDLLGRVEGLNFALLTTGPNFDAYNADLAAMGDAGGTAAEQAAERMKGFQFQWDRLRRNVEDAAITIGTELLPVFADLAEEGTAWLTAHQPEVKKFAQDLAAGIRDAVEWARKMDWDSIARALGSGADAAKTILSVFMALPAEMKGLLVGGYAVNKVTGGAVTDVAGLGLKTILSQFAMRGSSPANPLYVVPIGGMGGGGVPGGIVPGAKGPGVIGGAAALVGGVAVFESLAALPGSIDAFVRGMEALGSGNTTGGTDAFQDFINALPKLNPFGPNAGLLQTALDEAKAEIARGTAKAALDAAMNRSAIDQVHDASERHRLAAVTGIENLRDDEKAGLAAVRERVEANRIATVSAIRSQDLSVTVHMPVNRISISVPPATLQRQIIRYQTGGGVRRTEGSPSSGGGSHGGQGGHDPYI